MVMARFVKKTKKKDEIAMKAWMKPKSDTGR